MGTLEQTDGHSEVSAAGARTALLMEAVYLWIYGSAFERETLADYR